MPGAVWTQLECHTGLIVSCFPALNRIFRQLKQWALGGSEPPTDTVFGGARRVDMEAQAGAELYSVSAGIDSVSPVTESQERMVPEVMDIRASIEAMGSEASMEVVVIEHVEELGKMR